MNPKMLLDILEDCQLIVQAQKRLANDTGTTYTQEQVMAELGITEEDLDRIGEPALE